MADNDTELIKVKKQLYSYLECPVCYECMTVPIIQCTVGHSICHKCEEKVKKCPICGESFNLTRNFTLEKIIDSMEFYCQNSEFGCKEKTFLSIMPDHTKTCPYRLYKCLAGYKEECKWQGRRKDILTHVEREHGALVGKGKCFIGCSVTEFTSDSTNCNLLYVDGEIFWIQSLVKAAEKTCYMSVHYIGAVENCLKYRYKLSFVSSDYEISFSAHTQADHLSIRDIVESDTGCFSLKNNMAKYFTVDDHLEYCLEIIKAD